MWFLGGLRIFVFLGFSFIKIWIFDEVWDGIITGRGVGFYGYGNLCFGEI